MTQPPAEAGLRREISRLGFAALSLNGMIGAGIFALPAVAAAAGAALSPWLFVVCSVLIMSVVLSFARAASLVSDTGGPLAYVGQAFGPFAGFQVGWLFAFARFASTAANTNLMVTYAAWFWEPLDTGLARHAAVTTVIALLVYANVIGVRRGVGTIFVFTLLKLAPLALLVLLGLAHVDPRLFAHPDVPDLESLGGTLLVLMYAFVGFEGAVVPAGEARDPRRDIPRALAQSVLVVALLYVLIQVVSVSVQPGISSSERPLLDVMEVLMGPAGAALIAAGAAFSIIGNTSSVMLTAPRMVYAMGSKGMLPAWFGKVHERWATPANAICFVGAVSLVLALSGSFIWLAAMSTVARLIVYGACILALPRLEARADPGNVPFTLPGGHLVPLMGLVTSFWLILHASARSWLVTAIFMVIGTAFYVVTRHRGQAASS